MIKISFIIPIYKVEKYLRQCVESVLSQTYNSIEVILVDDGSPDHCPALCDEYALSDPRISVIHKQNGGLSDSRNAGLSQASGDYIVFLDGDDFWRHTTDLERLMEVVTKHPECDFIGYNCEYYYPTSNSYTPWVLYENSLSEETDKNTAICSLVNSGTFPMSACLKIIKRKFLLKNELFFVKDQIAEDIPWFINLLDKCSHCCFVNFYIYAYRQNVIGSITSLGGNKAFDSLFNIFKSEWEKIEKRSFDTKAKEAIKSFLAYEYCILLSYPSLDKTSFSELVHYKQVLNHTMNPKVKTVSRVYRLFGIRITRWVLRAYQSYRKSRE